MSHLSDMNAPSYEEERLENIQRNKDLLKSLGIEKVVEKTTSSSNLSRKKRKFNPIEETKGTRISARIASSASKPRYTSDSDDGGKEKGTKARSRKTLNAVVNEVSIPSPPPEDLSTLADGWRNWAIVAPEPERDEDGVFHFDSHPTFTPNKSPAEILREGAFGGGYFRPVYSQKLHTTISNDYLDTVSQDWIEGLNIGGYLTSEEYNPEVNKFGVACGQTIEEWEKAGWIRHEFDVRGWFQWYCRFFRGRRCEDDDRQVGRWDRCVGDKGRWRRILLKKYLQAGIRSVIDEGLDDEGDDEEDAGTARSLSPVVHQTCHHWAYSVTQAALDGAWRGI